MTSRKGGLQNGFNRIVERHERQDWNIVGRQRENTWRQSRSRRKIADRQQRRNDFQRETLLELQTAVADRVRAFGKMYHFDTQTMNKGGEYTQLPARMSEEDFVTSPRLNSIVERVLDDDVRQAAKRLDAMIAETAIPPTEEGLVREIAALSILVHTEIGRDLRTVL